VAASGSVEANVTALTAFQVGGRVARVSAEEGQLVKQGQVLAELDCSDYRNAYEAAAGQATAAEATAIQAVNGVRAQELEQARIDFDRAQDEYQRQKYLYDHQSLPANDFHKIEAAYLASQQPEKAAIESEGDVEFYFHVAYTQPAAMSGQALNATSFFNKGPEQYYYFPGQRRVRRLPNAVFDAPVIGYENQYLNDEQWLLWSTLDRFNYRLLGKKEIYVQYNSLKMHDPDAPVSEVYRKSFVNPAYRRYELHRVWVVDAQLKPAFRHLAPHRVYYLDEDSWAIASVTEYDQKGRLWKLMEASMIPIWELGGSCGYATYTIWDLLGGRYVTDLSVVGTHRDFKWFKATDPEAAGVEFKPDFFAPETLRANSER